MIATSTSPLSNICIDEEWNARTQRTKAQKTDETAELSDLAENIRTHGILQPVVVASRSPKLAPLFGDSKTTFFLVAGFRRAAAAKLAGLTSIPVHVLSGDPEPINLEVANLIENTRRKGIRPADASERCKQLKDRGQTIAQIAKAIGASDRHVANLIRLREKLSPKVWAHYTTSDDSPTAETLGLNKLLEWCAHPAPEQDRLLIEFLGRSVTDAKGSAVGGDGNGGGKSSSADKVKKPTPKYVERYTEALKVYKTDPTSPHHEMKRIVLGMLLWLSGERATPPIKLEIEAPKPGRKPKPESEKKPKPKKEPKAKKEPKPKKVEAPKAKADKKEGKK